MNIKRNFTNTSDRILLQILNSNKPNAIAKITGNPNNPQLHGMVQFYNTPVDGILVKAEIFGLPNAFKLYSSNFYGFHIHETGNCEINFQKTGNHYNPSKTLHPNHSGDLPPLLGNQGFAYSIFYTRRFTIDEIINKSILIHDMPDDFTSQPAGNSGTKIGCGIIEIP